jgi:hypothetical protein
MSDSTDPVETIKAWQDWYKNHRVVAEMDEQLVTKDSREQLHDTSNATDTLPNWRSHYAELIGDRIPVAESDIFIKQKATDGFADTIAEFINEMTGEEMYECFVKAVSSQLEYAIKEYDRARDLMDAAKGKRNGKA